MNHCTYRIAALGLVLAAAISPVLSAQDYMANPQFTQSSSWGFGTQSGWNGGSWSAPQNSGWQLGITGTNTETGVQVDQVASNSAAARAGLIPGDTIVCVAGNQVGRVQGRILEVRDEINARSDSNGRVSLLVLDGRSRTLRPMLIQLDRQQAGLTGSLMVSGGSVPPNSTVTVMLENMTRPHYSVRNGEQTFPISNYMTGEIPFSLNYDPAYIFPSDTYRVRAYISSAGRTLFDTEVPPYVLTQGNPSNVRISLRPVSYTAANLPPGGSNVVMAAGYANYDAISQQVNAAYQRYLGRPASSIELAAWHQLPDIQIRLGTMRLELMASQEYYDRVGNNNLVWAENVFREIVGRDPSAAE
ncbi:MAG: YbaY family lipoprotein, partial [bacterium]|nr:YbaY family lipoprotein [bacterium]